LTNEVVFRDPSPTTFATSIKYFSEHHPSSHEPTAADMKFLKSLAGFISRRSSAIIATSIYTLWDVRSEQAAAYAQTLPASSPERKAAKEEAMLPNTIVAFNGAVIEKYPGYLGMCQAYLDDLVKGKDETRRVELVEATESSLYGAAIALACVEGQ
jgi:hexokinase